MSVPSQQRLMKHVTRRGVVGAATVALAGCFTDDEPDGDSTSGDGENENPALESALDGGALQVRSPAFEDGESIPGEYGREEADVNPPLEISGVPDGAGTLALVVDDPDAVEVAGEIFVHWLVWNIPPETTSIPEDWSPETAVEGENDFGEVGYGGPAPPDEEHTYRFKCFVLDGSLSVEAGSTVSDLGEAMQGRILARAQLDGSYAP